MNSDNIELTGRKQNKPPKKFKAESVKLRCFSDPEDWGGALHSASFDTNKFRSLSRES